MDSRTSTKITELKTSIIVNLIYKRGVPAVGRKCGENFDLSLSQQIITTFN